MISTGRCFSVDHMPIQLVEELFDTVPNTVFFVKDLAGRYLAVNRTLVERCGRKAKDEVVGRTVAEFFPPELATIYSAQDAHVLRTGQPIGNKLELHLYANRRSGWCLTSKVPLRDSQGRTIGLVGVSRDVDTPSAGGDFPPALATAIERLHHDFGQPIVLAQLAAQAGLTNARFSRLIKRIFNLSPSQLLTQVRLQAASSQLMDSNGSVAEIAHACGFYDHSAFTRQFKTATGLTPLDYRRTARTTQR